VLLMGIVGALMVVKIPPAAERLLKYIYMAVFALVALTFVLRLASASLDHLQAKAGKRQLNVTAFMPWIKRIVLALIFVFGVLVIAQSLGANVRAFLAGLGIGGLAVALAAQDTLANIFGSLVIAVDQPFRLGEFVQIGPNAGSVEDIGLRSTRLRTAQKNLIIIPNKTVAAEPIVNLTRFIQRRVEQNFGLTYDSTPEQMETLVEDIRRIVLAETDVDAGSVIVQFTELTAASLNIWLAYNTKDSDFMKHLKLKQRVNLAIMRAVAMRGMRFAFPTQTVHVESLPAAPSSAPSTASRLARQPDPAGVVREPDSKP
jgi:MscS family membrane protein